MDRLACTVSKKHIFRSSYRVQNKDLRQTRALVFWNSMSPSVAKCSSRPSCQKSSLIKLFSQHHSITDYIQELIQKQCTSFMHNRISSTSKKNPHSFIMGLSVLGSLQQSGEIKPEIFFCKESQLQIFVGYILCIRVLNFGLKPKSKALSMKQRKYL